MLAWGQPAPPCNQTRSTQENLRSTRTALKSSAVNPGSTCTNQARSTRDEPGVDVHRPEIKRGEPGVDPGSICTALESSAVNPGSTCTALPRMAAPRRACSCVVPRGTCSCSPRTVYPTPRNACPREMCTGPPASRQVGAVGRLSPRHRTRCEHSFIESNGIL